MTDYRTTRDIIIPAGTRLSPPPVRSTRWGKDFDTPVALGRDNTGYFSVDIKEGLASRVIEETNDGTD